MHMPNFSSRVRHAVTTTFAAGLLSAAAPIAHAQASNLVTGIYSGEIISDDGLGFLGQNLTLEFAYLNDAPTVMPELAGFSLGAYFAFTKLNVSVGGLSWSGTDGLILVADNAGFPFLPVETPSDEFGIQYATTFTGDTLTPLIATPTYSFSLLLRDTVPAGTPDAITTHGGLPSQAPNPGLFSESAVSFMQFSVSDINDPSIAYAVTTGPFSLVSAVPEPSSYALFLTGLGIVGTAVRRRR
ncbi:PEP-CTERM sorting domain-containing protein [Nitrogeniibacter aestuarii]|uniref:PEP-CTERM sorting domain-containing protein n=1 Tax=Nitrogeniibacter aestuarii TaxID=2815343 RepID=UPI001D114EAD|nr:PEP-CTERM sorting domain-containing protein [Nitrogeniibacter aestuarii]